MATGPALRRAVPGVCSKGVTEMMRLRARAAEARIRVFSPENRLVLGLVTFALTLATQAFAQL